MAEAQAQQTDTGPAQGWRWADAPAEATVPKMRAPTTADPVTFGDFMDDPVAALERTGTKLTDEAIAALKDPKTYLKTAALMFGPKAVEAAMPTIGNAALQLARVRISPGLTIKGNPITGMTLKPSLGLRLAPKVGPIEVPPSAPMEAAAASTPPAAPPATGPRTINDVMAQAVAQAQTPEAPAAPAGSRLVSPQTVQQAATTAKLKLTASEVAEGLKLMQAGKTADEAMQAIQAMREFRARFGGATNEEVQKVIAARRRE